ncbi:RNA-binding (RRM/RBD/RNP motifs) family protein [Actinidia rufa]|uniref:RNA-binding (RRM/RBD/RNP motifs) family protein n=1 Tax=Actinidia rufa TaxID=165716 RepID=A0A7J0DQH6_9ERIC|nr:RNA-binding (RRM/RBD/RNP motifs) family protein [Actinidia rufa]
MSSPVDSPPAPGTAPSMAAMPPSTISSALDESPSTPPNAVSLNKVAVAGSAVVVFFAATLLSRSASPAASGGNFSMPKMPTPSSSGLLLPKRYKAATLIEMQAKVEKEMGSAQVQIGCTWRYGLAVSCGFKREGGSNGGGGGNVSVDGSGSV